LLDWIWKLLISSLTVTFMVRLCCQTMLLLHLHFKADIRRLPPCPFLDREVVVPVVEVHPGKLPRSEVSLFL
jgi:hypothetical protein